MAAQVRREQRRLLLLLFCCCLLALPCSLAQLSCRGSSRGHCFHSSSCLQPLPHKRRTRKRVSTHGRCSVVTAL
jgi:hypothetical protein